MKLLRKHSHVKSKQKRRKLTGPIKIKIFGIINQHKSKTAYVFISAIEQ